MNRIEILAPAFYTTPAYGVWRHDQTFCQPGKYRLVCTAPMLQLLDFQGAPLGMANRDCVVDDFGDLVAVDNKHELRMP